MFHLDNLILLISVCLSTLQVELLAQQSSYEALKVHGASLISGSSGDPQEEQSKQLLDKLEQDWMAVLDAWQQRMDLLEQCKNYLVSSYEN